jgi:hypothetical protein
MGVLRITPWTIRYKPMAKVAKLSAAVKLTMNFSCLVYSVVLPLPAAHEAVPHVMGSWVMRLKVK